MLTGVVALVETGDIERDQALSLFEYGEVGAVEVVATE